MRPVDRKSNALPVAETEMLIVSCMHLQNFEEYPEHRTNFFLLLQAVNSHCFAGTVRF